MAAAPCRCGSSPPPRPSGRTGRSPGRSRWRNGRSSARGFSSCSRRGSLFVSPCLCLWVVYYRRNQNPKKISYYFIAIRLSNSRQYRYHCKLLAPYVPPARLTQDRLHERNIFRDLFHSVSCLDMLTELAHNTSADILDERRTNDLFDICHTHLG